MSGVRNVVRYTCASAPCVISIGGGEEVLKGNGSVGCVGAEIEVESAIFPRYPRRVGQNNLVGGSALRSRWIFLEWLVNDAGAFYTHAVEVMTI
jgi:hypothetical protein